MYLVLIVDHIHELAIFQDIVFELNELFALSHQAIVQPLDLEGGRVNCKALIGEVCVQEPSKDHNLRVIQSEATQLTPLSIAAGALQENQFPMRGAIEVM